MLIATIVRRSDPSDLKPALRMVFAVAAAADPALARHPPNHLLRLRCLAALECTSAGRFRAQASRQHLQDQLESLDDVVEAEVFHHGEHVCVHVDEVCWCPARSRVVERVVLLSRLKNDPAPWREARRDVRRVG